MAFVAEDRSGQTRALDGVPDCGRPSWAEESGSKSVTPSEPKLVTNTLSSLGRVPDTMSPLPVPALGPLNVMFSIIRPGQLVALTALAAVFVMEMTVP